MTPKEIFERLKMDFPSWGVDMSIRRSGPSEQAVSHFERQFGIQLPADYLAFLHVYNGGYAKPDIFRMQQAPAGYPFESEKLNLFFYLDDNQSGANNLWTVTERFRPFIGKTALPVAEDTSGDVIFIETKTGQVQYATHEVNFEKAVVAGSFLEFLAALEYDPEDEPQP